MTQDEAHRLELVIVEGFSAVRGDINRLADREARNATDITELRAEVDGLKDRRVPNSFVSGILSVSAVAVALYAALSGR